MHERIWQQVIRGLTHAVLFENSLPFFAVTKKMHFCLLSFSQTMRPVAKGWSSSGTSLVFLRLASDFPLFGLKVYHCMWSKSWIDKTQIWFIFSHLSFPLITDQQKTSFPGCCLKRKISHFLWNWQLISKLLFHPLIEGAAKCPSALSCPTVATMPVGRWPLGLPGAKCTQPCCACSLEGVLGRPCPSVPLESTWCSSSYSMNAYVCLLLGSTVKAYLFHQLWAGTSIAVCLLLMGRLSDRFSSIVCLQFSETAPVGKAVCSHHSLKGEKSQLTPETSVETWQKSSGPLPHCAALSGRCFLMYFDANTVLALVWNASVSEK